MRAPANADRPFLLIAFRCFGGSQGEGCAYINIPGALTKARLCDACGRKGCVLMSFLRHFLHSGRRDACFRMGHVGSGYGLLVLMA